MINLPCVIFAGGKSSRMGEDKTLLPFAGFTTLTEFQYSRLSKIFTNVYISCKDKNKFPFDANYIIDKKVQDTFAPTLAFVSIFESLK
ncbi:MAG: molybdenum cofactor guanylyltransferase, partial [Sulfurimonas sp.]